MGLTGITREGTQGFQKVVWENVVDTLPGGLILDLTGYTVPDDGYVPEGTAVGKDPATGLGKIVVVTPSVPADGEDPSVPATYSIQPLGYTIRTEKAENNAMVGVGISGTIRIKALPESEQDNAADLAIALPRITHV